MIGKGGVLSTPYGKEAVWATDIFLYSP